MKLYAWRMEFFWMSRWNNIDFAIVIMGLFDFFISKTLGDIIPNMSMLRMFRIARLVRAVRILTEFKELYLMIHGFASAMMSMFWGFIMMALLLTVWSILAVEIIHPSNLEIDHSDRPWCEEVFSSVMMSNLMFFQTVVAGDSWGLCAIPIIKRQPLIFPLFAAVLFSVQIGFTNLILAVIVEQAARAREADQQRLHKEQMELEKSSRATLHMLCKEIDVDEDGELTLQELQTGFKMEPAFAMHLQLLGIEGDMLAEIFQIMDRDNSGALSYDEFIDTIHKTRTQDIRMLVTMVKFEMFMELTKMKAELELLVTGLTGRTISSIDLPVNDPEYVQSLERTSEVEKRKSRISWKRDSCASSESKVELTSSQPLRETPVAVAPPTAPPPPPFAQDARQDEAAPVQMQSEDMRVFLETLKAQMTHMLDTVANKVKDQIVGEEKSKLDSSLYGASKAPVLPPTFTPDGQWQLVLKPDWQFCGRAATRQLGPETKDGFPGSSPPSFTPQERESTAGMSQPPPSSAQVLQGPPFSVPQQRTGDQQSPSYPPPRTRPLAPSSPSPLYTCDALMCHEHMEVINARGSPQGLPPRPQTPPDIRVMNGGRLNSRLGAQG